MTQPTLVEIRKAVSAYYGMPVGVLLRRTTARRYSHPRQVAVYLAREITGRSLPDIAHQFGFDDHTTALHACRAVKQRIAGNIANTATAVDEIRAQLDGDKTLWRRVLIAELQACQAIALFIKEACGEAS